MLNLAAFFDLVGVAFFSIAGSLAAGRKRMDLFGVVVVGCVTAVGGGTLRDLLLGADPVFWIAAPHYILVAAAAAACTFFLARRLRPPARIMMYADAAGLAVFTVIGCQKGFEVSHSHGIAIVMGITTGVAGGIVRDVLCDEIPLIFRREIYALASLSGAVLFALVSRLSENTLWAVAVSISATLAIRLSAIRRHLSLPVLVLDDGIEQTERK
jgi:uncharacterized membrane protein YeiH